MPAAKFIALSAAGLSQCMECSSMLCSIKDGDEWNPPMPPAIKTLALEIFIFAPAIIEAAIPWPGRQAPIGK